MCRICSESPAIESMRADLSRVRSQYFFKVCPNVFALVTFAVAAVARTGELKQSQINDVDRVRGFFAALNQSPRYLTVTN